MDVEAVEWINALGSQLINTTAGVGDVCPNGVPHAYMGHKPFK